MSFPDPESATLPAVDEERDGRELLGGSRKCEGKAEPVEFGSKRQQTSEQVCKRRQRLRENLLRTVSQVRRPTIGPYCREWHAVPSLAEARSLIVHRVAGPEFQKVAMRIVGAAGEQYWCVTATPKVTENVLNWTGLRGPARALRA